MYDFVSTPAVVVELEIVENNIKSMIETTAKYRIAHRPHIKTHRSSQLAKLQLSYGAQGITCAKLGEAEVMVANGILDILIAYPIIGNDKLERYSSLARRCTLRSIINSYEGAYALSEVGKAQGEKYEVLIDIDCGIERGGIKPGNAALAFAQSVKELEGISIVGLMYYPGRIYSETTQEGIERVARIERDDLLSTKKLLDQNGINMSIISGGNTLSGKVPWCLEGLTEIRAGNYIFNDCAQLYHKRVTVEDCALRVVATVVARPNGYSAIIDAGTKALTSDFFPSTGDKFGYIIGRNNVEIYKLNEEHGFIRSIERLNLRIGEKIAIIPNHACVVTNLVDEVYGVRIGQFQEMIAVDARGRSN